MFGRWLFLRLGIMANLLPIVVKWSPRELPPARHPIGLGDKQSGTTY